MEHEPPLLITQPFNGSAQPQPLRDDREKTVTRLLLRVREGDGEALDRLFPIVYEELRALARSQRRRWSGGDDTLNTTALVHEAYLRLVDRAHPDWTSRTHFGAVAAKAMRHILIDQARRRAAAKRGGGRVRVDLTGVEDALGSPAVESAPEPEVLLALDEALQRLERMSERQSQIVELKFFGGMTNEEVAGALGISLATVKRGWSVAQAWLYREIERG